MEFLFQGGYTYLAASIAPGLYVIAIPTAIIHGWSDLPGISLDYLFLAIGTLLMLLWQALVGLEIGSQLHKMLFELLPVAVLGLNPTVRAQRLLAYGALLLIALCLMPTAALLVLGPSPLVAAIRTLAGQLHSPPLLQSLLTAVLVCAGSVLISQWMQLLVAGMLGVASMSEIKQVEPIRCGDLQPAERSGNFRVCHLSDLHITGSGLSRTLENKPSPNHTLPALLKRCSRLSPDLVLVTGDTTDSGQPSEWYQFFKALPASVQAKMVLVPGNHDVNIIHPKGMFRIQDADAIPRKRKLIRMMSAMNMVQGDRAYVYLHGSLARLDKILEKHADEFNEFMQDPPSREFEIVGYDSDGHRIWEDKTPSSTVCAINRPEVLYSQLFPMAVETCAGGPVVIVWDTCVSAYSIADNAIGYVPSQAMERLPRLLKHFEGRPILYGIHHHLALPQIGAGLLKKIKTQAMVLLNAREFFQTIEKNTPESIVLHGHRHIGYKGTINSVHVLAAPSSTLGDSTWDREPGFQSHELELTGSSARLARSDWNPIPSRLFKTWLQ